MSHQSVKFVKKLQRMFKDKNCNLKCTFTVNRVNEYFSQKCKTPFGLRSSVVYRFVCSVDPNISYIGRTSRNLFQRVSEHSRLTGLNSAISDHRLQCTCNGNLDSYKVMQACKSDYDLSICEALHIKTKNPSLNRCVANMGGTYFVKLFS